MKKILFIDQDGTMIKEVPKTWQVDAWDKVHFMPGAIVSLAHIVEALDYELVLVSNQDGLGTAGFPEQPFLSIHQHILDTFEGAGVKFEKTFIDRSFEHENLPTRKPGTAMLTEYMNNPNYDLVNSFVIGDRLSDMKLAKNLGAKGFFLNSGSGFTLSDADKVWLDENPQITVVSAWSEIESSLLGLGDRKASLERNTKETAIKIDLNLDGAPEATISTGLGFFDHMLEQIARHGALNLNINAKGDLHIDEHHTVEDTGLALGTCFVKALGHKKGIERYGFSLPMDDCKAEVLIDFGGRPHFIWEAEFKRERVGDLPTEMFSHFFKSFCDTAQCNLQIRAEGENEHHKIEAIFKAFAKAIKMAKTKSGNPNVLPSTKGVL